MHPGFRLTGRRVLGEGGGARRGNTHCLPSQYTGSGGCSRVCGGRAQNNLADDRLQIVKRVRSLVDVPACVPAISQ